MIMANTPTSITRFIPSLNFDTPIGIEDLEFGIADVLTDELCYRYQIAMQYVQSGGPRYGIVDDLDPASVTTASTRPFAIKENDNSILTIDCQPGVAVTKTGHIIVLTTLQEALTLADTTNSVENVVFVEYETVEDSDYNVETRYGNVASKRSVRPADSLLVQIVTLDDFQDTSIFSTARLNEVVVLGVVTPSGTAPPAAATELSFDLAQSNYSWNRPWFSIVDIEHRNELGTGASATPHNLGLSDLSQGDLTLYQQMLNHGIVISRDLDIPGCPGKRCYDNIPYASIQLDSSGDVTGLVGYYFAYLQDFPIRIVGAFSNADPTNSIAVRVIPHSNILVIATGDVSTLDPQGLTVRYTSASACKPPIEVVLNDEMQVGTPESHELVVSGGKGFNTLNQDTYSFGASGPIPKNFNVYCDGDGDLYVSPQIVLCYTKLDDIGTSIHDLDTVTLRGLAPARIGLTIGGGAYPSLDIQIKVTGKDKDDLTVNETLTFDTSWTQPATGPGERETATNFQITTQLYRSIDSIQVTNRVGDAASSAVIVYADVAPDTEEGVFDEVNDMLAVAHVIWNGISVDQIRDARAVSSTLKVPSQTTTAMADLQSTIGSVATGRILFTSISGISGIGVILAEDLNDLYYLDYDNSRLTRHRDGLLSTFQPTAIDSAIDDIWVSQAILLPSQSVSNTEFLVILQGVDVTKWNRPLPSLQYRASPTGGPWDSWSGDVTSYATVGDKTFYRFNMTAGRFKAQFRVQGAIRNVLAYEISFS
jgi:hypothetical protein